MNQPCKASLLVLFCLIKTALTFDNNQEVTNFDYLSYGDNWYESWMLTCNSTKSGSPVDLGSKTKPITSDISITTYPFASEGTATFYNTTIRVRSQNKTHGFGIVYVTKGNNAIPFILHSLQFRAPAAHTFNNGTVKYDVEMHVYGQNLFYPKIQGDELIISIMFNQSQEANEILQNLVVKDTSLNHTFNVDLTRYIQDFDDQKYYYYYGSQDMPFCAAHFHWFILEQPFSASAQQTDFLQGLYDIDITPSFNGTKGNNRKIQEFTGKAIGTIVYVHQAYEEKSEL